MLLIIGVSGVVFGGACAIVASNKNRHVFGWFVLGFVFNLIALVVIAALTQLDNCELEDGRIDQRDNRGDVPEKEELRRKASDLAASLAQSKSKLNNG
ncbi:hypothetical protein HFO02_12725 [Rhizobium laguerreae]|uniref:hypothetical protein n=1 Tax=Rhizobium laguerreae TaxID=1076926 RepID=UPI001C929561|nr:hypothetical protein [Rhizobium laguerreae]MBY3324459.1 hypothetical protein [Rhizobium laguerreae]